jgi:uncharacterized protein YbaA (DUF1428 family)
VSAQQKYVDTFVMPVSKSKVEDYKKFAEKMAALAKKHGALEYVNLIGDDVKPGKETSFPQAVKLHDDEIVVSSWAVYNSREDRDRANKAIMEDETFKEVGKNIPVDMKRMFTGGFKVLRGM